MTPAITSSLSEQLDYLDSLLHEATNTDIPITVFQEFSDICPDDFNTLSHIINQSKTLEQKPRLTYDYIKLTLLVEMPTCVHEVPCTVFKSWFDMFLDNLHFNSQLIDISVFLNAIIKTEHLSAIPNLVITFTAGARHKPIKEVIPVLAESVFTQGAADAVEKLWKEIIAKPKTPMVILALGEACKYKSPERSSITWKTLCHEKPAHSLKSFLALQKDVLMPEDPIVIADHTWFSLASIEIWVWIRGDTPINISLQSGDHTAHGRLFPQPSMNTINKMIERGAQMMKDCLVTLCKQVDSDYNTAMLEASGVAFPIFWDRMWSSIEVAGGSTAHSHYLTWYQASTRGVKHLEHPDVSNDGLLSLSASNTHIHTLTDIGASGDSAKRSAVTAGFAQPDASGSVQHSHTQCSNGGGNKTQGRGKGKGRRKGSGT
ncbi:hypothetical protein BDR07DRAFT_1386591 [Suillus spraguei]|nr:hypothetical protein BDR07DRAFT_1386591 [Suillus spraguei]